MLGIKSPCVRNCCLDEDDICLGCFRSIQEIMQWGGANEEQKQQMLNRAKVRKELKKYKRTEGFKIDQFTVIK